VHRITLSRLPFVDVADNQTVLVRISGHDRPGITAGLLGVLERGGAAVLDMEQVIVRQFLSLGVLVDVPQGQDLLKELLLFGWEFEIEVDFEVVEPEVGPRGSGSVVTVLGQELSAADLRGVASAIADEGGNIERIFRLSKYPAYSYELLVRGGDHEHLKARLLSVAADNPGLDVAIQREGLGRRSKSMVVIAVDSQLIQDEVVDLLADEAGQLAASAEVTERAMAGEIDFEESLRQRVALLAGLEETAIGRVWDRMELTPGARTFVRTIKRLGFRVAAVSGGFTQLTDRLCDQLDLDHAFGNELEVVDGRLTGELVGPIVDRARKAQLLQEIAMAEGVPLEQTVAVGDGANDLDMLGLAGLGIAFNAKPVVREAADMSLGLPYLDAILFVLGVTREEIEEADAEGA
jgi:phosphoserine phosphatase